jgi:hypothetical protein
MALIVGDGRRPAAFVDELAQRRAICRRDELSADI